MNRKTDKVIWPVLLLLPVLFWVEGSSRHLGGMWSLPVGIFLPWIGFTGMLGAAFLHIRSKRKRWLLLVALNAMIFLEDFRCRQPPAEGYPVISWNLNAPQSEQMDCIVPYLKDWINTNSKGLFILQEVSKRNQNRIEKEIGVTCRGVNYQAPKDCANKNKDTCPGLAICISKGWEFKGKANADSPDNFPNGIFQSELQRKQEKQSFKIINLHIESLWKTKRELDLNTKFEAMSPNRKIQIEQVEEITRLIAKIQTPVLIAGDFNSTQSMWIHRNLRKHQLIDSHRETGYGFGSTIQRNGVRLRTDFMYAKPPLKWTGPSRSEHGIACSDHWPISAWFSK